MRKAPGKTCQVHFPIEHALWDLLRRPSSQVNGGKHTGGVSRQAKCRSRCLPEHVAWLGSVDVDAIGQSLRERLSHGWESPWLRLPTLRTLFSILAFLDSILADMTSKPLATGTAGTLPSPTATSISTCAADAHETAMVLAPPGRALDMGALVRLMDVFMEEAMLFGRALSVCGASHAPGAAAEHPEDMGKAPGDHPGAPGGASPAGPCALEQLASGLVEELAQGTGQGAQSQFLLLYFCLLPDATVPHSSGRPVWPPSGLHPPLLLFRVLGELMARCSRSPAVAAPVAVPGAGASKASLSGDVAPPRVSECVARERQGHRARGCSRPLGGGEVNTAPAHSAGDPDGNHAGDDARGVACAGHRAFKQPHCLLSGHVASMRIVTGIITRVLLASARCAGKQAIPGATPIRHKAFHYPAHAALGKRKHRATSRGALLGAGTPANASSLRVDMSASATGYPGTLSGGQAQLLAWELLFALEDALDTCQVAAHGTTAQGNGPARQPSIWQRATRVGAGVGGRGTVGHGDPHGSGRVDGGGDTEPSTEQAGCAVCSSASSSMVPPPVALACFLEAASALHAALHTGVAGQGGVSSGTVQLRRLASSVWQKHGSALMLTQGPACLPGHGATQGGCAAIGCQVPAASILCPVWEEFHHRFLAETAAGLGFPLKKGASGVAALGSKGSEASSHMGGGQAHAWTGTCSTGAASPCSATHAGATSGLKCVPGQPSDSAASFCACRLSVSAPGKWTRCAALFDPGSLVLPQSTTLLASAWAGVVHKPWEAAKGANRPTASAMATRGNQSTAGLAVVEQTGEGKRAGGLVLADGSKESQRPQPPPWLTGAIGRVPRGGQRHCVGAGQHGGSSVAMRTDGGSNSGGSDISDWSKGSASSEDERGHARARGNGVRVKRPLTSSTDIGSALPAVGTMAARKRGTAPSGMASVHWAGLADANADAATSPPRGLPGTSPTPSTGNQGDVCAATVGSPRVPPSPVHEAPWVVSGGSSSGLGARNLAMAAAGQEGCYGASSHDEGAWGRHMPDDVLLLVFEHVLGVQGHLAGTSAATQGLVAAQPGSGGNGIGERSPQADASIRTMDLSGVITGGRAQGLSAGPAAAIRGLGDGLSASLGTPSADGSHADGAAAVGDASGAPGSADGAQSGQRLGNMLERRPGDNGDAVGGIADAEGEGRREGSRGLLLALCRLSLVCRTWCAVACDDRLWSVAYARRFGALPPQRPKAAGGVAKLAGAATEAKAQTLAVSPRGRGGGDEVSGGLTGHKQRKRRRQPVVKDDLIAHTMVSEGMMTWRGAFVQRARLWSRHRTACADCGMAFRTRMALREHAATHGLEYVCPWHACGRTFLTRRGMCRHERKKHVVQAG